jgi:hypothetical protein
MSNFTNGLYRDESENVNGYWNQHYKVNSKLLDILLDGNKEMLDDFLKDPNIVELAVNTWVFCLRDKCNLNLIKYFVENYNVNLTYQGYAALHLSIKWNHFDLAKYLAERSGKNGYIYAIEYSKWAGNVDYENYFKKIYTEKYEIY